MTIQFSVAVRNDRLDAFETTVGADPLMRIRTGAPPANTAAADIGSVIAELTLPSDWLADAANGIKAKQGTWEDPAADATGVAGHFRLYDSAGTTCHMQGTITGTGGGGDMEVDNTNFAAGQGFTITTFALTEGNA